MAKKTANRLGFREWQWKCGKNLGTRQDEIEWRRYYFRSTKTKGDKMIKIGSQARESLQEAGYRLVKKNYGYALLEDADTGQLELWARRDDFAGYVIEIDGLGYEFVSERR